MLFIIGSTLFIIGISTFAWYSFTWKKDFSKRYSKLNPKCISNSMLKYKRKSLYEIFQRVLETSGQFKIFMDVRNHLPTGPAAGPVQQSFFN